MWLNGNDREDSPPGVETIHNYYERLVFEEIAECNERARNDQDFFADVACVALNQLPPRYIRYDVDMTFFLSSSEHQEIRQKISTAVSTAIDYVTRQEAS